MIRIEFRNGSVIESKGDPKNNIRGVSSNYIWVYVDDNEEDNMGKVTLNDTFVSILEKISEGNPGALTCLMEMIKKQDWYFPDTEVMVYILHLDDLGLYGPELYMLWNDCCGRDLNVMETVLRNYQCGKLLGAEIRANLSKGRGTPFENLVPMEELFPKEEQLTEYIKKHFEKKRDELERENQMS